MRELKSGPMIEGDYDPLFKLEHMLKDVRYFLAESREMGVADRGRRDRLEAVRARPTPRATARAISPP